MRCVFCKVGETSPGRTNVTLNRGDTVVVFKNVPADVCQNCGEGYLSSETAHELSARVDEAVQRGAEVEIVRYAA